MGYFIKTIRPDIINGDVSVIIGNQTPTATDAPFSDKDLVFDWTPIDVPLRTNCIVDFTAHMYGEDGSTQPGTDFFLYIAKSNNGVAPTSLGTVNVACSGCFELPDILMGIIKLEGSAHRAGKVNMDGMGSTYYYPNMGSANGFHMPVMIDPEHNGLSGNAVTNRIYIAGIAGGAFDFSTGVKPTAQVTTSSNTIAVDGVDPRKAFRVGDQIYTNTEDTPCGTIASMTSSEIVLNANTAVQIEDNEELVNAKPITISLTFSSGKY